MPELATAPAVKSTARLPWAGPALFISVAAAILVFFWWFLGSSPAGHDKTGSAADSVAERIRPVGQLLVVASEGQKIPAESITTNGEAIYQAACAACHGAGIAGAPRLGDAAMWSERISAGLDALYANAISGLQGPNGVMPPRGGNTALGDAEVQAAVDYMMAQLQ
ncbi:MAG: c-type cytochrome [Arenicellales bacterium]|nr:c-type cytochrome [Arenicellales bacterium]MDP6530281.1 c-type cytochrome [Arenicellales bacterium]